jgi:hypothetical protein
VSKYIRFQKTCHPPEFSPLDSLLRLFITKFSIEKTTRTSSCEFLWMREKISSENRWVTLWTDRTVHQIVENPPEWPSKRERRRGVVVTESRRSGFMYMYNYRGTHHGCTVHGGQEDHIFDIPLNSKYTRFMGYMKFCCVHIKSNTRTDITDLTESQTRIFLHQSPKPCGPNPFWLNSCSFYKNTCTFRLAFPPLPLVISHWQHIWRVREFILILLHEIHMKFEESANTRASFKRVWPSKSVLFARFKKVLRTNISV